MAEAIVSLVVERLGSIMVRELEKEVRLVVGVEKEVEKMAINLKDIQALIADAETEQVKEATIRNWLDKLKVVAYGIEDVLDDWEAAILRSESKAGDEPKPERKVCSFLRSSCFCCKQVGLRHDIANKIKELNDRLDLIAEEKEHYEFVQWKGTKQVERPITISMIDITELEGRDREKSYLVNMLLSDARNDGDQSNLRVFSIVGMGGIGKTTLARYAFHDDRINAYFDKKIWVSVSDPFDEIRIAKTILESFFIHTPSFAELEYLLQKIGESIKEKKILFIMDDVWEENPRKWHQLKQSLKFTSPGSKVLVTTRKKNVALVMGCSKENILEVKLLSDYECWLIARKIAFCERNDTECQYLEGIGREISKKCGGFPLAAKALGGILRFRTTREEWQSILHREIWGIGDARRDVFARLWQTYYDLPSALKQCFSYCAIFPKDYKIEKRMLIELWMSQGYLQQSKSDDDLEAIGENYFQNLAGHSFFQDFEKDKFDDEFIYSCKMDDLAYEFAQIVARNECVNMQEDGTVKSIMGSVSRQVRHLGLTFSKRTPSSHTFEGLTKMRSLFFWQSGSRLFLTPASLSRLFRELTHVRSLSLRYCAFLEIPFSICRLVDLRWLDLSYNDDLKHLPEKLCELHNLQSIDVSLCPQLQLPHGIGNLVNLMHLHNYGGPSRLPKGIARLTGLRTLEEVDVGCDGDAFSLGDLKNLNQLRGRLTIKGLGARSHHVDETKKAELKIKEHITTLGLVFSSSKDGQEGELLEALEPSAKLEILWISNYKGNNFPGWMISLENLRCVRLSDCEHLPSLGKLPSLETLTLVGLSGLQKVGAELLGIETPQIGDSKSEISAASPSSSSPSLGVVAFPKLTKLQFSLMSSWEEWDDYYDDTTKPPAIIMPSLRVLRIFDCQRLKALPNYILQNKKLHTLEILGSSLLNDRYKEEKGEDWSKISHISQALAISDGSIKELQGSDEMAEESFEDDGVQQQENEIKLKQKTEVLLAHK